MNAVAMEHQTISEYRKLISTRSVYAMLAGLIAVVAFGTVSIVASSKAQQLSAPIQQQPFLHVVMVIAPLFGLLLGLRSFTDEFRYGSIVPTLLASPNRGRVLAAKVITVGAGAAVLTLVGTVTSIGIGAPILVVKGVPIAWSGAGLATIVGRLLAASAVWGVIGVGLGLAVKHQVAAIAGSLIWLLAAEGILSDVIPKVARYFPGTAGLAFAGISPNSVLRPEVGAIVLTGYAVLAVIAGAVLMQHRDIA